MVRERTPARTPTRPQAKSQLGDSWVVDNDGEDGDDETTPYQATTSARQSHAAKQNRHAAEPAASPRKRSKAAFQSSTEPGFIMPSLPSGSISGSWIGEDREGPPQSYATAQQTSMKPGKRAAQHMSYRNTEDPLRYWDRRVSSNIMDFVRPIASFFYDIIGDALYALKTPISYIVAAWLLIGILVFLRNLLFSSVYSALSPVCRIPGTQFLNLPMCHSSVIAQYPGEEPPPVQFDQLMTVQNKFEAVLQESAGGVSLPLDMKRGETSIRDLRQVVKFSQLHSKNELVLEFDGFIETAKIASYDLQRFNSHVGRGVDNILATARWTKRVLDGIAERDASQGALSSFFSDKLLAPFQPVKFNEDALLDQYMQHTRVVEDEINRLVTEAQALLLVLQNLEDRLDVIHGIAVRDDLHAQGGKQEVLSQLWTMLGGNRGKLGKYDSQLRLLNQVNTYRQNAIAHVTGTMIRLQGMGSELEELRERVGGVELLGGRGAVPLSVHIENIEMGVERLERGRKGAKQLENEEMRKNLGRGTEPERMIES